MNRAKKKKKQKGDRPLFNAHFINETDSKRQLWPVEGHSTVFGKGLWIASNAIILGPCEIGDYTVVAAGLVVLGGKLYAVFLYSGGVPQEKLRRSFI